jgi:hypothetical protein
VSGRERAKNDRLFSAAVLLRTFELGGEEHRAGFEFVYQGVLRDLDVEDGEVRAYLGEHRAEVDRAIGRPADGA